MDYKILSEIYLVEFYESLSAKSGSNTSNNCSYSKGETKELKGDICEIWKKLHAILGDWNNEHAKYGGLNPDKSCEYLNYWIYGKLKDIQAKNDDIDWLYFFWEDFVSKRPKKEEKCYGKKYNSFSSEEMGNKKIFYDFFEYYNRIKSELHVKNTEKDEYCNYIKKIFQLYKEMEQKNSSQRYSEDIYKFKKKFFLNGELNILEELCPDRCLKLVFNTNHATLCPFEKESPKEIVEEALKSCKDKRTLSADGNGSINKEYEDILKNFTEYKTYDELNKDVEFYHYHSICSDLLKPNEENCSTYYLCIKLAKNLKKLSEMKGEKRFNHCEYLIHWIYAEIISLFNIKSSNIYDMPALSAFFHVGYRILYHLGITDCYFDIVNIDSKELKQKKNLHDYFKNYNQIYSDISPNHSERKKYCEYITHINDLYNTHLDSCCTYYVDGTHYSDKCKNYFNCNVSYYPYNLYSKLKCSDIIAPEKRIKEVKPVALDYYVKLLTKKSHEQPNLTKWGNSRSSSSLQKECNGIICDPFYIFTSVAFTLMGIFLLFFIFYKFIPIVPWIHNKVRKKKNVNYGFQQSTKQFLEYETKHVNNNSPKKRLNIAYHQR
ncbi:Plasmodium vivax Vir protein, putative [Plasmodium ovale]|uniref:Plasmodium vivax Vir protein, putative n=1 Tax=Plasmodium ovale TaxID=36330 RepID=A0A1C3KJJ0_PLAOA|nr:Plasmodium vivax Vir protein, putative [Plasmodium ovale]